MSNDVTCRLALFDTSLSTMEMCVVQFQFETSALYSVDQHRIYDKKVQIEKWAIIKRLNVAYININFYKRRSKTLVACHLSLIICV